MFGHQSDDGERRVPLSQDTRHCVRSALSWMSCLCLQHYCFMLPKFCHKAVATDVESGISTDLAHHFSCDNHGFNSSKEYVQAQAIHDLFNLRLVPTTNINASDTCNCQHHDQKVGMCALRSTTCSMFNETTDVTKQAFSWQAWATDLTTSNVGHHKDKHGSATPSAAEAAALADLVKRYPAEAGCKNASAA